MGFMGFGMQKWIYTMRPRKPFSMQRKGSFTSIPTYSRKFKLQYYKNEGSYNFGIVLFLVIIMVASFTISNWKIYVQLHHKDVMELREAKEIQAFRFLMSSGKRRLNNGKISGAYSEFKLAYAIKPNNNEVNQFLTETLEILCLDYKRHCDDYNTLIQKRINSE